MAWEHERADEHSESERAKGAGDEAGGFAKRHLTSSFPVELYGRARQGFNRIPCKPRDLRR
jgi:hypothetical protein